MSNVSTLFENLMTYNENYNEPVKTSTTQMTENDTTLLNLTVELPTETEEITPEDVKVNVGVMNVFQDEDSVEKDSKEDEEEDEVVVDEESDDESTDVTPEDEDSEDNSNEEPEEDEGSKEESLKIRKEVIRQKRLEAKKLREAKKDDENKDCTGKEDCTCESCKSKIESVKDVETAKANIRKRVNGKEEGFGVIDGIKSVFGLGENQECKKESLMHLDTKSLNKLFTEFVRENYKNIDKVVINKAMLENKTLKIEGIIRNNLGESTKIILSNIGFNPAKLENKRFVMDFKDTSNVFGIVKESVRHPFVFTCTLIEGVLKFEELKYSYKTMHESKIAEVSGKCTLLEGLFDGKTKDWVRKESNKFGSGEIRVSLSDDGLGFVAETKNKEALVKQLMTAGYKELNGDYYRVDGKQKMYVHFKMNGGLTGDNQSYTVTFSARKEDIKQIKEATLVEDANQIKKFHEIVDKIKAAKTSEDLSACKDEMDDSNIGDTLLSAAQMVWDDISSRINASV